MEATKYKIKNYGAGNHNGNINFNNIMHDINFQFGLKNNTKQNSVQHVNHSNAFYNRIIAKKVTIFDSTVIDGRALCW